MGEHADAVVVGGSIGGLATAVLLAQSGARVTVLEKAPSMDHHKVVCAHYIQPPGVPVLARMGVLDAVLAADARTNTLDVCSPYGWYRADDDEVGLNLRREVLDPLLRRHAAATPGVTLRRGVTATDLLRDASGRPSGVRARTRDGASEDVPAALVVAADGRGSQVARWAGIRGRVQPNVRFVYWTYVDGADWGEGRRDNASWFCDPECFYAFTNDGGQVVLAHFATPSWRDAYRQDKQAAFRDAWATVPDAPVVGPQLTSLRGKLEMPNVSRPAAAPGVAFVGDAALAADPLWGVGIGFALQAAAWLTDAIGSELAGGTPRELDAALDRYRRRHRRMLGAHHLMMSDYARGRGFNPLEQRGFRGATRSPEVARTMSRIAARGEPVDRILTPAAMLRIARVGAP